MSVANAGPAAGSVSMEATDPLNHNVAPRRGSTNEVETTFNVPSDATDSDRPVAPDQFNPLFESTRKEIWSYYAYYIGNNGLTLFNFGPTLFQDLLYLQAGDAETLKFLGSYRSINSIVLLSNGISFAIQTVIFLILGSTADYGSWRSWILVVWSVVAFGLGFGWLGVHHPSQWPVATGLYMVGLIAYQMCITFWTAAFPSLARNTVEMRMKAEALEKSEITRDEYDFADMMQRNRISNVAFIMQSAGEIVILAVLVGILHALDVNASDENNLWGLSVLIAYATGCWVVLAMPWFWFEKKRPGQKIPAGMNIVTVGFWGLWRAMTQIWKLKQSLIYLIGFFVLSDALNTTVTVVATLQNAVVSYNTLKLTYLLIVGIATQLVGIFSFWTVQKRFKLSTKNMFDVVILGIVLLDGWGMIGIWTDKFGFHNEWEFWLYQVWYGVFVCPWYSYSQIMISEVTPRGHEFLFFALFSIMGKTSAFIGPIVSSAIIDADSSEGHAGNQSTPFYFLFALALGSMLVLNLFVDLKKSRKEQEAFLEEERKTRERRKSIYVGDGIEEAESPRAGSSKESGSEDKTVLKS